MKGEKVFFKFRHIFLQFGISIAIYTKRFDG